MNKNKHKILVLLVLVAFALFLFSGKNIKSAPSQTTVLEPKVLGAYAVKIRGLEPELKKEPELLPGQSLDFSKISAKSFLVYDELTKKNLADRQKEEKLPLASLTKLLTALVAYENLDLAESITINASDKLNIAPILNLIPGDVVRVGDLFSSMLIGSANDSALTLAHFTQKKLGKDFVGLMNDKAKSLDMQNSSFSNPLGFDSKSNFSTAEDLKKLVLETQKYSAFVSLGKRVNYSFESLKNTPYFLKATNKLVFKHSEVESVKTGYTPEASGALISKVEGMGRKIVIIVLGSQNREQDTLDIAKEVFSKYNW